MDSLSVYRVPIHFIQDDYIPYPKDPSYDPWLDTSIYSTFVTYANDKRDGWYSQVPITDICFDFEKHSDFQGPLFSSWVKEHWYNNPGTEFDY